jgi:MFS family permease
LYPYRWVVLAVFMFVNLMIQVLWISYSPVTINAIDYFKVKEVQIGLLAMVFMIAFVPFSIPASWAIDTLGFRKAVGFGALMMGVFGVLRGLAGTNYILVLLSTIGIAIGQPFLMNSWTTLPARWFQKDFRATAVGMITLSSLLGIAISMVLTPVLFEATGSLATVQLIYGSVGAFSAVLFIILARNDPPTPPCADDHTTRALVLDGLKSLVRTRMFWQLAFVQFIGMAIFNGITTWVEPIVRGRSFGPAEAGYFGALMLIGGVAGALVLPSLSDKYHRRKKYLLIGLAVAIPFLVGLTFLNSFVGLLVSSFGLGFFLTGCNPIIMQFATEITYPVPEGTSNGLLQLFGQISVVFVYLMEAMKTSDGSFTPSMILAATLLAGCVLVSFLLKDPKYITKSSDKAA